MGGWFCAELSGIAGSLELKHGGIGREVDRAKRAGMFMIEREWYWALAKRL